MFLTLEKDLGTPFKFRSEVQELGFQQHVNPKACRLWLLMGKRKKKKGRQRPGRFSTENKTNLFPSILHQQILWGLSSFTPSSIPNESCFFKPMGANKTPVYQLEVNKSKQSQNADTNGRGEGVQGRDRAASDQAEKANKGLGDTRLGVQDF